MPNATGVAPHSIDLYINSVCDLACTTCFLGDDYFDGSKMSPSQVEGILAWAARNGARDVAFLGGEPTLHPDLLSFIRQARDLGFTTTRVVSNGGPALRRLMEIRHMRADRLYLSLDGAAEATHDSVRGAGSFRNVVESMALARELGQAFTVTTTVTPNAVSELPQLVELVQSAGAQALNVHWLSSMGRARTGAFALSGDEWAGVKATLSELPLWRSDFVIDVQDAFSVRGDDRNMYCALREGSNLQFMPRGAAHACGLTVDDPNSSAFIWDETGLTERPAPTEREVVAHFTQPGCPVRQVSLHEATRADWVPLCIYLRSTYSRGPDRV